MHWGRYGIGLLGLWFAMGNSRRSLLIGIPFDCPQRLTRFVRPFLSSLNDGTSGGVRPMDSHSLCTEIVNAYKNPALDCQGKKFGLQE